VSRSPFGALALFALLACGPAVAQEQAPSATDAGAAASAIAGPFAIGATVRDSTGETVGRITRLTTAPDGRTLVMVRLGVDSFAIPASALRMQGDVVVSRLTKAQLKAQGEQAQK
jgi:hypothetical protein